MAIKENQFTDLNYIGLTDKVRMVTSGGTSNNGPVGTLAETILSQYRRNFTANNETAVEAIRKLDSNSYMGQGDSVCYTDAATTAKTASISGYRLTSGGIVTIRFQYAVPANSTLNISDTGALPIYYNSTNITANIIQAGDVCTFICNTARYALISKASPFNVLERSSGNTNFITTRTDTNVSTWFGVGTAGTNHGIWSTPMSKWLIHSDGNRAFFNGGQIDSGRTTITPSAANTPTSKTISFGKTFTSVPIVTVTAETTVPGTIVTGVGVTDITTTGCKIWLTRTNTSNTNITWIATSVSQ